jgi:hypothetical protein
MDPAWSEMMKSMLLRVVTGTAFAAFAVASHATTIAYWNFNNATNQGPADLGVSYQAPNINATMTTNFEAANVLAFAGSTVNAQFGDPAGQALGLQGGTNNINNGRHVTIQLTTSHWQDLMMSYATQRTSTGFNSQTLSWSTNGTTFTTVGAHTAIPTSFALHTWDLSGITALNNAPNVWLRLTFDGATSASGNNRIDNLVISANPVPEPATMAALALGVGAIAARRRRRK